MQSEKFSFKNDKYRKARGGCSRFLNLFCEGCEAHVALYQKDGPGELRRMYIDRVCAPELPKNAKEFTCASCERILGTFFMYKKEGSRPSNVN